MTRICSYGGAKLQPVGTGSGRPPINLIIDVHYGASQVNGHVEKPSALLEW